MNVLSDFIGRLNEKTSIESAKSSTNISGLTDKEIKALIGKYEKSIEELKNKIKPKVIRKTKPVAQVIDKVRANAVAIDKKKAESTAISATKKSSKAIAKTKTEAKVIEKTKKAAKSNGKTKKTTTKKKSGRPKKK